MLIQISASYASVGVATVFEDFDFNLFWYFFLSKDSVFLFLDYLIHSSALYYHYPYILKLANLLQYFSLQFNF